MLKHLGVDITNRHNRKCFHTKRNVQLLWLLVSSLETTLVLKLEQMVTVLADQPIGIFDSGVGGLTVLRAMRQLLPNEHLLYLGDTARVPYGTKSVDSVCRYARQAAQLLVDRKIKLLTIACNTASAVAIEQLQDLYQPLPVIGVLVPGAQAACAASNHGKIAVIATESTVRGGAYEKAIRAIEPKASVDQYPCSLLVALAEEGWVDGPIVEAVVQKVLHPVMNGSSTDKPDCLVLGCTHLPVLAEAIGNVMGPTVKIIDSATTTAAAVRQQLSDQGLLRQGGETPTIQFLATDSAERFARVGEIFLGHSLLPTDVEHVDL